MANIAIANSPSLSSMPCLKRIETESIVKICVDYYGLSSMPCLKRIETFKNDLTCRILILRLSSMPCLKRIETFFEYLPKLHIFIV